MRLLGHLAELARRRAERPLDYVRWLAPQDRWLRTPGDKLYRAGNQALGKSTAGLAEVIWRGLGAHPHYEVPRRPIEAIVCSLNQSQSIAIQGKAHALLPAGCLHRDCEYSPKTGYGANRPMTRFANGSTIRWVTDDQGPRAVAGATVDVVLADEPCGPEMMRELRKRLMIRQGVLLGTMTPINGPTAHIREMVDAGQWPEVHAKLTAENLRFADSGEVRRLADGTLCDAGWVAGVRAKEPSSWAAITLDGEWEVRMKGAWFAGAWDAAALVSDRVEIEGASTWHLGIDYAAADRPDGLVSVLVQVFPSRDDFGHATETVIVQDLVCLPGSATVTMLAQDTLRMLGRHGLHWRQLRTVYGDNPVQGRHEYKGNADMTRRLAFELRAASTGLLPKILSAKEQTSGGSRDTGCRYLYEAMASRRLIVRPRCAPLVEAIETWDYSAAHPAKDRIDALRYALKDFIFPSGRQRAVVVRFG